MEETWTQFGMKSIATPKRFSSSERHVMERQFVINPYPSREEFEELAVTTGADPKNIRIWFQNNRRRTRVMAERAAQSENRGPDSCVTSLPPVPARGRRRRVLTSQDNTTRPCISSTHKTDSCNQSLTEEKEMSSLKSSESITWERWDLSFSSPQECHSTSTPSKMTSDPKDRHSEYKLEVRDKVVVNRTPAHSNSSSRIYPATTKDASSLEEVPLDLSVRKRKGTTTSESETEKLNSENLVPCFPPLYYCPPAPVPVPPKEHLFSEDHDDADPSTQPPRRRRKLDLTDHPEPVADFPAVVLQPYPCILPTGETVVLPYPMVAKKDYVRVLSSVNGFQT